MKDKTKRPRVLVVDDYPDAREMYSEYLEFSGFDVIQAVNGIEALQRAVDAAPDIILMDLSLPVMDGWEATRRLKDRKSTRLNSSHTVISYAVFCLKKKNKEKTETNIL